MTDRARRFVEANARAPVEYFGAEAHRALIRLTDGSTWELSRSHLREIGGQLRFKHLEKCHA